MLGILYHSIVHSFVLLKFNSIPSDACMAHNSPFQTFQGYKRTLQYEDVFDTPDVLKTASVYPGFAARFQRLLKEAENGGEKAKRKFEEAKEGKAARYLLRTVIGQHKGRILFAMTVQLCYAGLSFVGPIMLKNIVQFLTASDIAEAGGPPVPESAVNKAWLYAMGMFLAPVVGTVAAAQANRIAIGTSIMIRSEITAAIYRKALSLSTRSRQATETGRVVNLMSADVNSLQMFFYPFASQLLTGPVTLITALVLLWFQIKWATFIGLAILMLSTPATAFFLKKFTGFRREMLKYTDQRVKLMNQLLVGIRVLKMYAWESAQEAALLEVRRKELGELRKGVPYRVGMQALLFSAPLLSMVVCFIVYGSVEPAAFQPANVFTAISLFAIMRFPLIFLPFALIQFANALVSMRRLTQFFMLEDRKEIIVGKETPGIEIVDGDFFWADPPPKIEMPEVGKKKKKKEKGNKKSTAADTNNGATEETDSGKMTPVSVDSNDKNNLVGSSSPDSKSASADKEVAIVLPGMTEAADGTAALGKGIAWQLRNVNVSINSGELVCVVGRVGAGKTSLVQAILGEMETSSGIIKVGGSIAYASQQAWIINATVKENVSFGKKFDEDKWQKCVDACCLAADLEVLQAGADTEIGEKGINLSGGQKQRISLARALYQDSDVYILDDPLSAVDVHVGRHIFENFINGAIKDKARLLVTNQLQYLPHAHKIVLIDAGEIIIQGTYEECLQNESFARLLAEHNSQVGEISDAAAESKRVVASSDAAAAAAAALVTSTASGTSVTTGGPVAAPSVEETESKSNATVVPSPRRDIESIERRGVADAVAVIPGAMGRNGMNETRLERGSTFARLPSMFTRKNKTTQSGNLDGALSSGKSGTYGAQLQRFETMRIENKKADAIAAGKKGAGTIKNTEGGLMMKEDQEIGQVTGKVYWQYITTYGVISFFGLLFFWSCEQSVRILTNWYLSQWTTAEVNASINPDADFNRWDYVGGYLGLALGFTALTTMRALMNLLSALRASRLIHHRSLSTLVRAPVTFFDTTPVGRILNRFSKDTDDIDFLLSMSMTEFGNCIMQLIATLIFLSVVQPIILAGVAPLMIIYYFVQRYYRRSYIELQRLDSVSRSPIYAHFSESLSGVETIRAYRLTEAFALSSDARVDSNHRAYFTCRMANEWLSMRLDFIGACIVFLTAALAIVRRDLLTASLAALTMSEALDVTLFLKAAVTSGAMFESRFNSVERLAAYWSLPQEADAKKPDVEPKEDWPHEGALQFQDVWMRYRPELDPVLKGVSFEVSPGDKIGIVGRTGSGKSSLIVTLFRLVEPFQGKIVLDGIDILSLGLDDVRGRIAAIPQDPILFSGSVRQNLDPYQRHSDAELWDALSHVALKEVISGLPEGLSARVAEGGENFSVGQRQLLCVARALLRNPRVLVADEATASVDSETDALIQRTIRREFRHCTVLTIAHRINTVLDSTKVLVMDDGLVKEFDEVPSLMGRKESTFRAMVVEAGLDGSPAMSRSASAVSLVSKNGSSPGDNSGGRGVMRGFNTFVKKYKDDYGLK
jgi:ABC-type multidrug transport system fused ATPase/permease subunit